MEETGDQRWRHMKSLHQALVDSIVDDREKLTVSGNHGLNQNPPTKGMTFRPKGTTIRLLDALAKEKDAKCRTFMGLFPEIERAWMTLDNQIFIWDYHGQDFIHYQVEQVIISATLVEPQRDTDIFHDWVKYLLVLTTPIDITILALCFLDPDTMDPIIDFQKNPMSMANLQLKETPFYLPTDGIPMKAVAGLDGRIFLGGSDGCLHELVYTAQSGWWTKNCYITNLDSSNLRRLQTFFNLTNTDPIVQIVVDKTRNYLYTLSEDSVITMYCIDEGTLYYRLKYTTFNNDVRVYSSNESDMSYSKIVSLSVEDPKDPNTPLQPTAFTRPEVCLFATTKIGDVVALAISNLYNYNNNRPNLVMTVEYPIRSLAQQNDPNTMVDVTCAYYKNGVTLLSGTGVAQGGYNNAFDLVGISKYICVGESNIPSIGEYRNCFMLKSPPVAIAEIPVEVMKPELICIKPQLSLNELIDQHLLPRRQFHIFNYEGISIFERLRPIDQLACCLAENYSQAQQFLQSYGHLESCTMYLTLACSYNRSGSQHPGDKVMTRAKEIFFYSYYNAKNNNPLYGNVPQIQQQRQPRQSAFRQIAPVHPGYNAGVQDVVLRQGNGGSSWDQRFDLGQCTLAFRGLVLYLSRLLRFVNDLALGSITPSIIDVVQPHLKELDYFLSENASTWMGYSSQTSETEYWKTVHNIVKHSDEILSLARIVSPWWKNAFTDFDSGNPMHTLAYFRFEDLATDLDKWKEAQKNVMLWLQNIFPDQLKQARENLLRDCKYFFSNQLNDRLVAWEDLQMAEKLPEGSSERNKYVERALQLCLNIASHLELDQELVEFFHKLKQYDAICTLALTVASDCDPQNEALIWFQQQNSDINLLDIDAKSSDDAPFNEKFQKRMHCYSIIYNLLTGLNDKMVRIPTWIHSPRGSKDKLFQAFVFTQLLRQGTEENYDLLLRVDSTFVKDFLKFTFDSAIYSLSKDDNTVSRRQADLLWCYYIKHEEYRETTHVLASLADSPGQIPLEDRIQYLKRSIFYAKLIKPGVTGCSDADSSLLQSLEEKLDIAIIQKELIKEAKNHHINIDYSKLSREVLSVSDLYNEYASKYGLFESCLSIFHSCKHQNQELVNAFWEALIQNYAPNFEMLQSKVEFNAQKYSETPYFPATKVIEFLLESCSVKDFLEMLNTLQKYNISYRTIIEVVFEKYKKTNDHNYALLTKEIYRRWDPAPHEPKHRLFNDNSFAELINSN